jgi:hypothetical protein
VGHGYRAYDFYPNVSLAQREGYKVVAAADGTVCTTALCGGLSGIYNGNKDDSGKAPPCPTDTPLANYVRIKHADGTITEYDHLKSVSVTEGQQVDMGQVIGVIGKTGCASGTHLHFERTDHGEFYFFDHHAQFKAQTTVVQSTFSMSAVRLSTIHAYLSWTYGGSDKPTSFVIQRMTASGWRLWDIVSGTTNSYSDFTLSPAQTYSYRIGATTAYGTRYSLGVLNV